jgi:hypothetical protein
MNDLSKKIVKNKFKWIPMNQRTDKLGLPLPPRAEETRRPFLWLAREKHELYLVNSSNVALQSVTVE